MVIDDKKNTGVKKVVENSKKTTSKNADEKKETAKKNQEVKNSEIYKKIILEIEKLKKENEKLKSSKKLTLAETKELNQRRTDIFKKLFLFERNTDKLNSFIYEFDQFDDEFENSGTILEIRSDENSIKLSKPVIVREAIDFILLKIKEHTAKLEQELLSID